MVLRWIALLMLATASVVRAQPAESQPGVASKIVDPWADSVAAATAHPSPQPSRAMAPHTRGLTLEIGWGLGRVFEAPFSYVPKLVSTGGAGESPNGIGLGLGAGWFITHDIALSLRLSGTMIPTLGIIFVGEVGPSLQVWLGPMWFGGGLGLHVVTGCDAIAGCAGDGGVGFNLRMGVAIDRTETRAIGLAIEASSGLQPSFGAGAIPSVSILIAGQIL